jgi:hypothetical protein|tara:strand:- start:70 stop:675 length:606 start_codon:yes stop_codon:yes gene_type:complete
MAKSYTELFQLVRSLAGVDSFTSDEENDIKRLANRRLYEAYSASQMWTPYLVVGEERTISSDQVVPFEQTPKNTISEFQRIHRDQPFLNSGSMEYNFYVDSSGAHVMNLGGTDAGSVYVTYKKKFEDFTEASQDIPEEFFYFAAHATYADFLRMDGQTSKAFDEENKASTYLATELEKLDIISNNNNVRRKFTTYVSTQSR